MSDTKHGWVTPRADGARARCGGPGICTTCNTEAMHEKMLTGLFGAPAATPHREPAEREAVDTDSFDDPSALAAAADALSGDTSNDNAQFAAAYLYRQAKALAAPVAPPCLTCDGHGMVGGLTQHSGYDAEPCPDCAAPGVSTVDDEQDFDAWLYLDQTQREPGDMNKAEIELAREAFSAGRRKAAPAAGDALDAHFDLWQDDMVVASASGPRPQALDEIQHYAAVYGQDGPVQIEEVIRIPLSDELAAQRKRDA